MYNLSNLSVLQKMKSKHVMVESTFVCAGVLSGQSWCLPQFLQSPQDPAEEPGDGEAGGADCHTLCHPEGVPCSQIPRVSSRGRSWYVSGVKWQIKFLLLDTDLLSTISLLYFTLSHIPLFSDKLTVSTKIMPPWLSWFRTNWTLTRLMTPPWERSEAAILFYFFDWAIIKLCI